MCILFSEQSLFVHGLRTLIYTLGWVPILEEDLRNLSQEALTLGFISMEFLANSMIYGIALMALALILTAKSIYENCSTHLVISDSANVNFIGEQIVPLVAGVFLNLLFISQGLLQSLNLITSDLFFNSFRSISMLLGCLFCAYMMCFWKNQKGSILHPRHYSLSFCVLLMANLLQLGFRHSSSGKYLFLILLLSYAAILIIWRPLHSPFHNFCSVWFLFPPILAISIIIYNDFTILSD